MANPISGHTKGSNEGLTDGEHIISPSLTNIYEGLHGNGILSPYDTAYTGANRNTPASLPGAISQGANASKVTVKAFEAIIDGILYDFGGGSDITITLGSTGDHLSGGSTTSLTSGQECLFIIIATAAGVKFTQSNIITTAVGAYPSVTGTSAAYLTDGKGTQNQQSFVLGTVRATNSGGSTVGPGIQALSEFNDKRVFLRPTPLFFSPVTKGNVGTTTGINSHTALAGAHTGESGDLGDTGVIWQSFNSDNESMLYYTRKDSSNRHTHLLGPTNINVSSPSGNLTFTFDSDQVFVLTPTTTINLNPSGTFPPGHTVFVSVPSGSTVTFDSTGLNSSVVATEATMFVYDGANWKKVMVSGTISPASSGASGIVQLSDGAGGFTSDTTLSYDTAANELIVNGKLTVSGLIDPTGLEITPQSSNPAAADGSVVDANTLWLDSTASNRLKQGSANVIRATDSVTELSDVSSVGSGAIITGSERSKLSGIATSATATAAPAIEDNSGTPAFATGITKGGVQSLLNIADGATANAGTVTSVATTAPITGGTITGSGTIGISPASATDAGSMSSAHYSKLEGIEAAATADQTNDEIRAAVEAATDSNVFTDADHSKLNAIATGATAYADADAIAAVEGEATLALTGDVTIAAGKGLTVDGTTLHVDAANDRVGIGTASPATALHVEGANHIIRVKDTSAGDTALTRTMGGLELSAAGMNTSSKFGVPIKFMSTDSAFTTENPKFLAAIVPIARESYTADTKGGMAIGFAVTANTAGASTVPQVAMTLDSNGRLGIGTGGPQAPLHVTGTIRQTTVTNAVLVANANGDLAAASNLADLAYLAPGGAQTDTFTPTTSAASWVAPAPTTIQQAIERIAAFVVALPGAPAQIPP